MAKITNYTTLLTEIADVLNRSDLTATIPGFVQRAENRLARDERARLLVDLTPLSVDSEEEDAPADMVSPGSIAHDGATYFGELDLMPLAGLTEVKRIHGNSGVPLAYAIRMDGAGNTKFVFAPEPDTTYTLQASYYAGVTNGSALSATNLTNRFLLAHPDLYLYASLVESAPYLREDERIAVWEQQLEQRLEHLRVQTQNRQFGGSLSDFPRRTF